MEIHAYRGPRLSCGSQKEVLVTCLSQVLTVMWALLGTRSLQQPCLFWSALFCMLIVPSASGLELVFACQACLHFACFVLMSCPCIASSCCVIVSCLVSGSRATSWGLALMSCLRVGPGRIGSSHAFVSCFRGTRRVVVFSSRAGQRRTSSGQTKSFCDGVLTKLMLMPQAHGMELDLFKIRNSDQLSDFVSTSVQLL